MKFTAFNAQGQIAFLSCTRKTAKRTALRTIAGTVIRGATRAGAPPSAHTRDGITAATPREQTKIECKRILMSPNKRGQLCGRDAAEAKASGSAQNAKAWRSNVNGSGLPLDDQKEWSDTNSLRARCALSRAGGYPWHLVARSVQVGGVVDARFACFVMGH